MNTPASSKSDDLTNAAHDLQAALDEYIRVQDTGPSLPSTPITYRPDRAPEDRSRYVIAQGSAAAPFRYDAMFGAAENASHPALHQLLLSVSPHWEDRIRAVALQRSLVTSITLPDQFPCIYEPATSPRQAALLNPAPLAFVVSADEAMLAELLPLYQELWSTYETQWPHSPNRHFVLGRLDGLSPLGVYRPGTSVSEVLAQTMLTHTDMYRTAPDHLKAHHPLHRARNASAASTP